jgi:hypothetical protein
MNNITPPQVSKGKLLIPFKAGLADGWMEGPQVLERSPIARPKIKLPLVQWRTILAFLVDTFDELGIEAQASFWYHHEKKEWKILVPEQWGTSSVTHSIDCTINDGLFNFLAAAGFEQVGSIHTHCTMSAFQSSVDKDDEEGQSDGFHITIGKMKDSIMDVHCRCVSTILGNTLEDKAVRVQTPFFLAEFIDGLPDFDEMAYPVPFRIRNEWTNYILLQREEFPEEYPDVWVQRVGIKDPYPKQPAPGKYVPPPSGVSTSQKSLDRIEGVCYDIGGVLHKYVNGELVPISKLPHTTTSADKQWWQQQKEKEEAQLAQELEDEEQDELDKKLEKAEMLALKQDAEDDENTRVLDEAGRIYGVHV